MIDKPLIFSAAKAVLGERLILATYKRVCLRRYLRAGVIFVHIPRAAGTSVARAVIGRRAGHFTAAEIRDGFGAETFARLFSFAIVRNPFDRLVSAYHYARQGGGADGGIEPAAAYASPAFASFEKFVWEWLVLQDITRSDYVFRPQIGFVYEEGERLVDYVGRLENLSDVERFLTGALDREITLERANRSARSSDYSRYYTPTLVDAVSKVYQDDLAAFGYSFD